MRTKTFAFNSTITGELRQAIESCGFDQETRDKVKFAVLISAGEESSKLASFINVLREKGANALRHKLSIESTNRNVADWIESMELRTWHAGGNSVSLACIEGVEVGAFSIGRLCYAKRLLSERQPEYALDAAGAVVVVAPPYGGKSTVAKACARLMNGVYISTEEADAWSFGDVHTALARGLALGASTIVLDSAQHSLRTSGGNAMASGLSSDFAVWLTAISSLASAFDFTLLITISAAGVREELRDAFVTDLAGRASGYIKLSQLGKNEPKLLSAGVAGAGVYEISHRNFLNRQIHSLTLTADELKRAGDFKPVRGFLDFRNGGVEAAASFNAGRSGPGLKTGARIAAYIKSVDTNPLTN